MFYLSDYMVFKQILFTYETLMSSFYGYHFNPSKDISSGDISNFFGIPPLLFGDISMI